MEPPTGPRLEALCAICIQELYNTPWNQRRIGGEWEKGMEQYPSKIIAGVLAGTNTVECVDITGRGNGHQLTFRAVTVFQGTDLCAGHVTKMAMMGTRPHYPREYTNR